MITDTGIIDAGIVDPGSETRDRRPGIGDKGIVAPGLWPFKSKQEPL